MTKTKKRGFEPSYSVLLIRGVAFTLLATVISAACALFACSAAAYSTADPAAHVDIAAYAALAVTALCCGIFSAVFCRGNAFLCALSSSALAVCVMLLIAAFSGGVSAYCVTVYAAFMLISVLFSGVFSRKKTSRPKRRR